MPELDHAQTPLLSAMQEIAARELIPFYTPGHKRGIGTPEQLQALWGGAVFAFDLPELPGLDNWFAPESVIAAAQILAADAFGAEQTYFLANGSTSGIAAAILATVGTGDLILIPRNAHRSVWTGLILAGAMPIVIEPEYDAELGLAHSLTPAGVQAALAVYPETRAILTVSPTYHGVCGDVSALAAIAHGHGLPLIVDEAHGAHFAFHPELPTPALAAGADMVIQSTHKTLSALTQAAMLHVQGDRIDRDRLRQTLNLMQSTSPNYLLLASLDAARQQMVQTGRSRLDMTLRLADRVYQAVSTLPGWAIVSPDLAGRSPGFFALDHTRLTLDVSAFGLTGYAVDEWLCDRQIFVELPSLRHITLILSLGNTAAHLDRLLHALAELSRDRPATRPRLAPAVDPHPELAPPPFTQPQISPRAAFFAPTAPCSIADAVGQISAELICPYPPGIPLILPGEAISAAAIATLQTIQQSGGHITGAADPALQTLKVVRQ